MWKRLHGAMKGQVLMFGLASLSVRSPIQTTLLLLQTTFSFSSLSILGYMR